MTIRLAAGLGISALCCAATGASAAQYGAVVSSTPVVASVPVTQRQCYDEQVVYQQPSSGAGALLGAIAGAAIGNTIGSGGGRAAATGIGMVTGAAIGDRVEAGGAQPVTSTAQRCRNVTRREQRTVGYDVVYEYQGMRRSVRLAQDPGDQIALEVSVTPVGVQAPGRAIAAPPAPVYRSPGDATYEEPYEQTPPPRVIYAPQPGVYASPWPYVAIGAAVGSWYGGRWYGGGGGHGHGHRR